VLSSKEGVEARERLPITEPRSVPRNESDHDEQGDGIKIAREESLETLELVRERSREDFVEHRPSPLRAEEVVEEAVLKVRDVAEVREHASEDGLVVVRRLGRLRRGPR
jgi:hypothetical protein